jgi:hypothetical protein
MKHLIGITEDGLIGNHFLNQRFILPCRLENVE